MTIENDITTAPDPKTVLAGEVPGNAFFRSLASVQNGAHSFNSLDLINQTFVGEPIKIQGQANQTVAAHGMLKYVVPVISRSHRSLFFSVQANHIQEHNSTGNLLIRIYDGNENGALLLDISNALTISSSPAQHNILVNDVNPTQSTIEIHFGLDVVVGSEGLGSLFQGSSNLSGVFVRYDELDANEVTTTKTPQGVIIPVGSNAVTSSRPASAALGRALMITGATLMERNRLYVARSAVHREVIIANRSFQSVMPPMIRAHIIRVHDTSKPLLINYCVTATNLHETETRPAAAVIVDPRTLMMPDGVNPNIMGRGARGERVEFDIPAASTKTFTGTIEVDPPFETLTGVSDGHFIAIAAGTASMSPRHILQYNEFDGFAYLNKYSFWGQ